MGTPSMDHYDIVVAGLGMSTSPLVEYVARNLGGLRMLVLDRGEIWNYRDRPYPSESQLAIGGGMTVDPAVDRILLRTPTEDDDVVVRKWWAPDLAGGGSLLWYGQMSRFKKSDFEAGDLAQGRSDLAEVRNWPISAKTLAPYYEEVERSLAPIGCDYGYSTDEYLQFDCRRVELRAQPALFERTVIDSLRSVGIRGYVGQTCLGGRAWDQIPVDPHRLRLHSAEFPLAHRRNWYARIHDLLMQRPEIEHLSRTYVSRLIVLGGRVCGVSVVDTSVSPAPIERQIRAKWVVLGCGALETIRILLSSSLPNRNGLLGKRLTFTTERNAYLSTHIARSRRREDELAGLFGSVVVKDFYEPDLAIGPLKGGKLTIYDALAVELPHRHVRNLGLFGAELRDFLAMERNHYVLKLSFKGESFPWSGKYVELSDQINGHGISIPRVWYAPHPEDQLVNGYAVRLFERVASALGGDLLIHPVKTGAAVVSAHQHGGAVFGNSPDDAVLSPDCECFEARGLFVIDGSFMPTSGATNSSSTLMANSLRVAEALCSRLNGKPKDR